MLAPYLEPSITKDLACQSVLYPHVPPPFPPQTTSAGENPPSLNPRPVPLETHPLTSSPPTRTKNLLLSLSNYPLRPLLRLSTTPSPLTTTLPNSLSTNNILFSRLFRPLILAHLSLPPCHPPPSNLPSFNSENPRPSMAPMKRPSRGCTPSSST